MISNLDKGNPLTYISTMDEVSYWASSDLDPLDSYTCGNAIKYYLQIASQYSVDTQKINDDRTKMYGLIAGELDSFLEVNFGELDIDFKDIAPAMLSFATGFDHFLKSATQILETLPSIKFGLDFINGILATAEGVNELAADITNQILVNVAQRDLLAHSALDNMSFVATAADVGNVYEAIQGITRNRKIRGFQHLSFSAWNYYGTNVNFNYLQSLTYMQIIIWSSAFAGEGMSFTEMGKNCRDFYGDIFEKFADGKYYAVGSKVRDFLNIAKNNNADYSLQDVFDRKDGWSYTLTPPAVCHDYCSRCPKCC
jgi:hypothetical protein